MSRLYTPALAQPLCRLISSNIHTRAKHRSVFVIPFSDPFHVSSNLRVSIHGMSDPGERRSSRGHSLTGGHHQDREQQGNVWLGGEGVFRKRGQRSEGEREPLRVENGGQSGGIIWNTHIF